MKKNLIGLVLLLGTVTGWGWPSGNEEKNWQEKISQTQKKQEQQNRLREISDDNNNNSMNEINVNVDANREVNKDLPDIASSSITSNQGNLDGVPIKQVSSSSSSFVKAVIEQQQQKSVKPTLLERLPDDIKFFFLRDVVEKRNECYTAFQAEMKLLKQNSNLGNKLKDAGLKEAFEEWENAVNN